MIQNIITDDKWPLILEVIYKTILDVLRNNDCILKIPASMNFLYFKDTKIVYII